MIDSNGYISGSIVTLLMLVVGYWFGHSMRPTTPEPNPPAWKAEKLGLLRELRERLEQIAAQGSSERDRYKVRLQEIGGDIAALDEELGTPTRRKQK